MCDVDYDRVTKTTHFNRDIVAFSVRDQSIPFRLVGSYEYARSLQRFEQLLEMSTLEQIKVYDQLLAKEPQFSFYAGMYLNPEVTKSLDTSIPNDRIQFDEHFLRSGMKWMMALAKVELGSTVSTYGNQSLNQPFSVFSPNQLDAEACFLVLADDLQAHVKNLEQDDNFAIVVAAKAKVDNWTFAYLRRARLMQDMTRALLTSGHREVVARLKPLARKLDAREDLLQAMIDAARKDQVQIVDGGTKRSTGSGTSFIDLNADCDNHDLDNLTGTTLDQFDQDR